MPRGGIPLKRTYFLVGVAILQILVGSLMLLGAAQPVQVSQDVLVPSGTYYHFDFGILNAGRLSGNVSELQGRAFNLFVFDDPGYASFRAGSNAVLPLFERNGTTIVFDLSLPGSGQYHIVAAERTAQEQLQLHIGLVAVGLKTNDAILAMVVLAGGLALVGASLMLSVWAWRRAPPVRTSDSEPSSQAQSSADPPADPPSGPEESPPDPSDDNTRIY